MPRYHLAKGYVHLITGEGPGKTTSALGISLRCLGHGMRICIVQFLKGKNDNASFGEIKSLKHFKNLLIKQFGRGSFLQRNKVNPSDIDMVNKGLKFALDKMMSKEYDLIILDEVNVALDYGLLEIEKVLSLIKSKPNNIELILTGRNAPDQLYAVADYIVVIHSLRHPFENGVQARKGIEY
jgi:cob(I)alamin adenosyltransferase